MLVKRIIPCLDVKNGRVVKGVNFVNFRDAGDPVELGKFYAREGADELIFLDITATYERRKTLVDLVERVAEAIDIPFTVGGGIAEIKDMEILLRKGADKISLGSVAVSNPDLVREGADRFGSQCIVISVDPKRVGSAWKIFVKGGREETDRDALEFVLQMEEMGAGELLVNSLDRDGTREGYDLELLAAIKKRVKIPVIASSGAGKNEHFLAAFDEVDVDAVLAASLFHYGEMRISDLKKYLAENDIPVRLS